MREIKFRAWDKENNCMIYAPCPDLAFFLDGSLVLGEDMIPTDRFIKLQFTGLKDKNGKECFDGDIVKRHYTQVGVIKWDDIGARFRIYAENRINEPNYPMENIGDWEIIGNIYENPNLSSLVEE